MEKEHLEILLEDIQGKFELVLEGHESIRKEIRDTREELNEKHEHAILLIDGLSKKIDGVEARLDKKIDGVEARLDKKIDDVKAGLDKKIDNVKTILEKKIDDVAVDLAAHRADTETHGKAYQVSKSKK